MCWTRHINLFHGLCVLILSGAYHYSHWQHDLYRQQGYYSYHHQYVGPAPCFFETMLLNRAVDCPCTLTKTGWFKPTATPTAQPVCPGGEDCGHGGNDGGNNGGDHGCDGEDCGSNGGNPGGNGGHGGGSECNGKDCGNNGGNGGNPGGNGVNPGGNGGNNGNNGGNECNGKDCGSNGGNPGSNGGNPGSNGGNNGGSGNPTPAPQGGCDEKTGAGCPADQTPTGAQPTGTSVVVAGANVNGLSAGAMVVAGFAAMML